MQDAGIEGSQANPKGLRYSFGVLAAQKGIPLNLLQRLVRTFGHYRHGYLC